jgi:site-specific DNA-cytosine methylase
VIIVGCEYSGTVREAFNKEGYMACSVDLLSTEQPGQHYIEDLLKFCERNKEHYKALIAHPPCTHLAVSGARWFKHKEKEQKEALEFVQALMDMPFEFICIENPVSIISSRIRKPDQIIQPWMFGHEATKTTCLWLRGLPPLTPTNVVSKGERHVTKSGKSLPKWYNIPPSADRWKLRSATFPGIATAMAQQWGPIIKGV